ncbi:ABC transporter permease [uncultured Nocardioides sp.]|uniref:ABC transporter permease n=1 Tax=uncultured Nocardioides sp. TaxID=198441 RepID=UPI00262B8E39|nr:ABC transporter permease [uncultured Nocardioides sp.]
MSTTTPPVQPAAPSGSLDISSTPPVPFGRLVRVELRKSLDTRAGRWFAGSIVALCLAIVLITAFAAPDAAQDLGFFLTVSGSTLGHFLPILLILMVTSEWSQRTGLVTFTLEPHRARVVGAKFCAGLLLGLGLIVLAFAIGALGNVIAGGDWEVETGLLVNGFLVANLIGIVLGFAIGMLLMNSPAAIVAYFIYTLVLPIAVGILGAFQEWFADLAPWIEFNTAQASLFEGDAVPTGEELGQLLVSGFIWLVVPFAVGLWRLLRAEPK